MAKRPFGAVFYWGKERFVERSRYQTIRQSDDRHQMTEAALHTPVISSGAGQPPIGKAPLNFSFPLEVARELDS